MILQILADILKGVEQLCVSKIYKHLSDLFHNVTSSIALFACGLSYCFIVPISGDDLEEEITFSAEHGNNFNSTKDNFKILYNLLLNCSI